MNEKIDDNEKFPLLSIPDYPEDEEKKIKVTDSSSFVGKSYRNYSTLVVSRTPSYCCVLLKCLIVCLIITGLITITAVSKRSKTNPFKPRCDKEKDLQNISLVSVHLIVPNGTKVSFDQVKQLQEVTEYFPNESIEIIIIETDKMTNMSSERFHTDDNFDDHIPYKCNKETLYKNIRKSSKRYSRMMTTSKRNWYRTGRLRYPVIRNYQNYQDQLLNDTMKIANFSIITLEDLHNYYLNTEITKTTFEEIFKSTSLNETWKNFNMPTALFAARVIRLWDFGGIDYDLLPQKHMPEKNNNLEAIFHSEKKQINNNNDFPNSNLTVKPIAKLFQEMVLSLFDNFPSRTKRGYNFIHLNLMKKIIRSGKHQFEILENNAVVADCYGNYLMSKQPCNEFFGDLLLRLKNTNKPITNYLDVLGESLEKYCKRIVDVLEVDFI